LSADAEESALFFRTCRWICIVALSSLKVREVKSSILERNVRRIGDVFAL
jgi:hypothetical protein